MLIKQAYKNKMVNWNKSISVAKTFLTFKIVLLLIIHFAGKVQIHL